MNQVEHVIWLVRRRGHEPIERLIFAIQWVDGSDFRRPIQVVARKEPQQVANQRQARAVVVDGEVRNAAPFVVRHCAAERFFGNLLVRHRLNDVGPRHEHIARVANHDRKVGDRRRVHGAACARTHHRGDLRHDARRQRIAKENLGVAGEREDAFLNARAARVVQADNRRAHLDREIHDLHDFGGVGFGQRSAKDGEILCERVDGTSVYAAVTGDDAVARDDLVGHPEIEAAMGDELVDFFERIRIEQQLDALAGGQLAGRTLALETLLASSKLGSSLELVEPALRIHYTRAA